MGAVGILLARGHQNRVTHKELITWGLRIRERGKRQCTRSQKQGSFTVPVNKTQEIPDGFIVEAVVGIKTLFRS